MTLLAVCGCGLGDRDPYARHAVKGTVTLDGEPLRTGTIVFHPAEKGPVVAGTVLQEGEFAISAEQGLPVGKYKVSITCVTESGPLPEDEDERMEHPPDVFSLVPKRYNSETVLTAEVLDQEINAFDFELQSDKTVSVAR